VLGKELGLATGNALGWEEIDGDEEGRIDGSNDIDGNEDAWTVGCKDLVGSGDGIVDDSVLGLDVGKVVAGEFVGALLGLYP